MDIELSIFVVLSEFGPVLYDANTNIDKKTDDYLVFCNLL